MKKFIKQFYLIIPGIIFLNFHVPSRSKVLMVHLKLIFLLLLAITIFSCYSTEPDCGCDIIWEPAGSLPYFVGSLPIAIASNGNIWLSVFGGQHDLYLSTNNGDTWDEKYNDNSPIGIFVNPANGYIFRGSNNSNNELMRSTNNGESWETIIIMDNSNLINLITGYQFQPSISIHICGYRCSRSSA